MQLAWPVTICKEILSAVAAKINAIPPKDARKSLPNVRRIHSSVDTASAAVISATEILPTNLLVISDIYRTREHFSSLFTQQNIAAARHLCHRESRPSYQRLPPSQHQSFGVLAPTGCWCCCCCYCFSSWSRHGLECDRSTELILMLTSCTDKLKFHESSFLVAFSWHPREDVRNKSACRARGI